MADASAETTAKGGAPATLERRLGTFSAATLIVGSMIGSGIFLAPALMARLVASPGVFLGLWVVGGLLTLAGALSFAELAAMMPRSGGQYVYLREAFGPLTGFLFGWAQFAVVQCGFNAAVSVGFAKYLGVFVPGIGEKVVILHLGRLSLSTAQLVAVGVILLLSWVNARGVREGAAVQNLFTALKVAGILFIVFVAFGLHQTSAASFHPLFSATVPAGLEMGFFAALAVAMSKALAAYDAWNNVTFISEEVKDPARTLPRSLLVGTLAVTLVYTAANAAYLAVVPLADMPGIAENRVAATVATRVIGHLGAPLVAAAILASTFGCVNGLILGGARVLYAMAKDGLFFSGAGRLSPRATPVVALAIQAVWSIALALTGSYDALLTYIEFASLGFSALTVVGLFVLRYKRPDAERPYRVRTPVIPALYLAVALFFMVFIVVGDPRDSGIGALIIVLGVPLYLYFARRRAILPYRPEGV